ncbi:MAG: CRTAC1 family protein, partial [Acidobacteria bacterium]|nr:CRTAC1 family protein [Acidobacteriota bacterium]
APRGAMGIDAGDLDGDTRPDLVVGNFAQEMSALFRQRPGGIFVDDAAALGVGLPTLMTLTFGTLAVDLDGDGWLDLVFANGHIEPEIERFQPLQTFAQPLTVFRNLSGTGFEPVKPETGSTWARPLVARGLAAGDLDGDGDPDLVISQNGGPAVVLRNDFEGGPYLRLRLEGRSSNRSALGARIEVSLGDRVLERWVGSGRSYLSSSDKTLGVGLDGASAADAVRITWPSGRVQDLAPGERTAGGVHRIVEDSAEEAGGRTSP